MFDENGTMRNLCIKQGYVPEGCKLDGFHILALVKNKFDPCVGCNEDRPVCGGRIISIGCNPCFEDYAQVQKRVH